MNTLAKGLLALLVLVMCVTCTALAIAAYTLGPVLLRTPAASPCTAGPCSKADVPTILAPQVRIDFTLTPGSESSFNQIFFESQNRAGPVDHYEILFRR